MDGFRMSRRTLLGAVGAGVGIAALTTRPGSAAEGEPVPEHSDEFNGTTLDTTKWHTLDSSDSRPWYWDSNQVSVGGGTLKITMDHVPDGGLGGKFFKSGVVRSDTGAAPYQRYGRFEARIRGASLYPGVCPAFWLARNDDASCLETEIDIVEMQQNSDGVQYIGNARHIHKHMENDACVTQRISQPWTFDTGLDPRAGFHVYALEWGPEVTTWYFDGQKTRESPTQPYFNQDMIIILSLGLRDPLRGWRPGDPAPAGLPTTMEVDYIRTWRLA